MELEKYFQSFEHYFWEFDTRISSDSGGEIISIPNTFTIAYEQFIFEILQANFACFKSRGKAPFPTGTRQQVDL